MTNTRQRHGSTRREQSERARWSSIIARTGGVDCPRCHQPIRPGDPFDMGHPVDQPWAIVGDDPTVRRRPEHRSCNRSGLVLDQPPTFPGAVAS